VEGQADPKSDPAHFENPKIHENTRKTRFGMNIAQNTSKVPKTREIAENLKIT
jgi:hypothetical protein